MKARIFKLALLAVIMAAGLATTAQAQVIIIIVDPLPYVDLYTFDVQSIYGGEGTDMLFEFRNLTGVTWTDFHLFGSSTRHGGESGDGSLWIVDNSYDGIGSAAYSGGIVEGYSTDLTITDIAIAHESVLSFHISTAVPDGVMEPGYLNVYPTIATNGEDAIPEPATLLLVGLGLAGAGLRRRLKR